MKVLVVGSGAREHAFCWKLRQSKQLSELYCAPGNPGTASVAQNVAITLDDISGLVKFAREKKIDFVLVGPELPLTLGLTDALEAASIKVFGPSQAASQLESSKDFTKELLTKVGVKTAAYRTFTESAAVSDYLSSCKLPIVVKADGLAAGKGVIILNSRDQVADCVKTICSELNSSKVVVEEFLTGVEASFIVATDGERVVPMATSHDYKRLLDGQRGPNTGGMGAISPTPRLTLDDEQHVINEIIHPVLAEMRARGTPFRGFLYAGLMITPQHDIYVLEFNCRMGDPECQPLMRRFEGDLLALLLSLCENNSKLPQISWSKQVAAAAVLAARGYPESPQKGDPIYGLEQVDSIPGAILFHAATTNREGTIVSNGGRVLTVSALGDSLEAARRTLYRAVDLVQFKGVHVRRDIGQ